MIPESAGCLSLRNKHLKVWSEMHWRSLNWRDEKRKQKHLIKAQRLHAKANRLLKQRNQETLGEFPKVYDQWGRVQRGLI